MLRTVHTVAEVRAALAGKPSVGLVPTMGALHEGHGSLIDLARRDCECVAVSLFVNPIQFDHAADLEKYPRAIEADSAFCGARGVDVLFAPTAAELYPRPQRAFVEVETLTDHLCGKFRPGHFRGVATVVLKLFEIVRPHRAYFGEKDAQQLAVIRRMTADLNVPVEIVEGPTVREPDGLALSSRNCLLAAEHRRIAPLLYRALRAVAAAIETGETAAARALDAGAFLCRVPEFRVEYFEIVDAGELQPVETIDGPVRVAAAGWLGGTRLIDNVLATPPRRR